MYASLLWVAAAVFIVGGLAALTFGVYGAGLVLMLAGVVLVVAADYAQLDPA